MDIASKLDSDRLRLVPLRMAHALFFWRLHGSAQVRRFLGGPVPWRRRIAQLRRDLRGHPSVGIWVAEPKARRGAIGLLVLSPHKDGAAYELSYQFLASSWGQGLAGEAAATVVAHALKDLELGQVIAETQSANHASCRMLERLGFQEARRLERFGAEQVIFAKHAI